MHIQWRTSACREEVPVTIQVSDTPVSVDERACRGEGCQSCKHAEYVEVCTGFRRGGRTVADPRHPHFIQKHKVHFSFTECLSVGHLPLCQPILFSLYLSRYLSIYVGVRCSCTIQTRGCRDASLPRGNRATCASGVPKKHSIGIF